MPVRPLALGVQSNPGRHPAAGSARLINAYAEDAGQEGVIQWPVWCVEGLVNFCSLDGSDVEEPVVSEALYWSTDALYWGTDALTWG